PDMAEIALHVQKLRARLVGSMQAMIGQRRAQAQALSRALGHLSPRTSLNSNRQRLDSLVGRLDQAMQWRLERNRSRLAVAQAGLAAVGPLATLSRGYAIVRRADGQVVRSVGDVAAGEALHVQVSDGEFGVRVEV
ncbi:MAG: exodeoxyribonuclease VII large subunit, partial [Chloroflexi bacterium]|nr:exodeoxyribonuclease VII large subunit [Chloroflexota bacterium]